MDVNSTQKPKRIVSSSVEEKRKLFLETLRSGKYEKGCTKSDEVTGKPIFEKASDYAENTACACAIMGNLFGEQPSGKISLPKATKALGLKATDCRFIQREINDRKSTLQEDADIIETIFFNPEKYDKVYNNAIDRISSISENKKPKVAPIVERLLIRKIVYDFKLSGKIAQI